MTSRWWRALTIVALALIAPAVHAAEPDFSPGSSLSQEERAQLQAQYNQLFAQMLQHPTDLDLMFSFAAVATRLGNYEAAISTLERMLLLNPDLPRVKLELGELYFHIRSYAVAQSYFQAVVADPSVPATVKQNAQLYLTQIDKLTSLNHLAGSITAGFRYQTNANVGPSSNQVVAFGVPAILNTEIEVAGPSKVSGETAMYKASDYAHAITADIAKRRGVTFEFGQPAYSLPAAMDPAIRVRLNQVAESIGIPTTELTSGGGHDATVFAACGVPAGMIFICNDHGSHNPDEAMEMADFGLAAELLTAFITGDSA